MNTRATLVTAALLTTAAVPVWGQTAEPMTGPANGGAQQGAAAFPDFSGTWGYPFCCTFEPPLSGPGPVLNKSRVKQAFGTDGPLPPGKEAPLVSNPNLYLGDYSNPILKPWAAEVVKKNHEGELSGVNTPLPSSQCYPEAVPFIFWNFGMQMVQEPGRITIIYRDDNQVRRIRMNQPHPAQVTPSWYGDSVGHYEGDTLVIDTVGIKADRPLAVVDQFGTPYTEALHVVERYRLLDYEAAKEAQERGARENFRLPGPGAGFAPDPNYKGKGLQLHFTVEDAGAFTTPWSATITYRHPLASDWQEFVCAENTHEYYAGRDTEVPRADKPDF
jgi:hypothetical protein